MRRLLIAITILLLSSQAWAATYWVRTDGADDNCTGLSDAAYPGTGVAQACAKKTIKVGIDLFASAGNTLYIRSGTYAETVASAVDRAGSDGSYNKVIGGIGGETILNGTAIAATNMAITADYNWIEGITFTGTDGTSARITIDVSTTPAHTVITGNKFKDISVGIRYRAGGGSIYNNVFEGTKETTEAVDAIWLYPNAGTAVISYNIFRPSENYYIRPIYADSTLGGSILNNVFTGMQRSGVILGAAQVLTVSNNIFMASGQVGSADSWPIANYGTAGNGSTLVGGSNMYLPNGLNGLVIVESSITDNTTSNLYDSPRFIHPPRESYTFMTIDDAAALNDSLYLAQTYYNPSGLRLINAIQYWAVENGDVSHDNAVALINAGNDIASHGYSHTQLNSLVALTIDGPTANSKITITTTTTDPDSDNWTGTLEVLEGATSQDNVNLVGTYGNIAALITYLNDRDYGDGAWSCTAKTGITQPRDDAKSVGLDPQSATDVSSATDISFNQTNFYAIEVTEAASKLQSWVRTGATGRAATYTVEFFIAGGNLLDNNVRDVVASAGLRGARSDSYVSNAAPNSANLSVFYPFSAEFWDVTNIRLNGAGYKGSSNVSFSSAAKTITVVGATLITTNGLAVGDVLTVVNTTSNDKEVTISDIEEAAGDTTITVTEDLTDESNSSAVLTCEVKFKRNVKAFMAGQEAGGNFRELMNHSLSSLIGLVEIEHQWFAEAASTGTNTFRHSINDVLDTIWDGTGEDGNAWTEGVGSKEEPDHTLRLDHVYVDMSDYRLRISSPAINAGVDVSLTTDYAGNTVPTGSAPEIGSYEYVVTSSNYVNSDMGVFFEKTATESLWDAQNRWFSAKGFTEGGINQRWAEYLLSLGYTQNFPESQRLYFEAYTGVSGYEAATKEFYKKAIEDGYLN
jgi:hypothetical protein